MTVVGSFASIQAGQTLQLKGVWGEHPKYGLQFQVAQYQETKPATITGIEKYLGSGLIKGVGAVTAKRIVAHFGLKTLDIIETEIGRLSEVPGIAKKRIALIENAWVEQKSIKDVMVFLQGHGVSTSYAVKIYKQYGELAIASVTTINPYQLAVDIYGIGFLTADKIAQNLGVSPWSKSRYRAGIWHILSESAESEHCYLPETDLIPSTVELLTIPEHESDALAVLNITDELIETSQLILDIDDDQSKLYYKPTFFHTEKNLALLIRQHLANTEIVDKSRVKNWITQFTRSQNLELSPQQQQAVEIAAREKITILTGGPGTGKTFSTRTIVALFKAMGRKIALAAPTGRAAKRLSEMTGLEAKTLHRLLEFDPATMGFKRARDNPLPYSAIVVDEVSMLDLFMAHSLFKAVPSDCQLLLVGDVDQLPSVGPGNVLRDLISSDKIPVVRLTQVFRQAATSGIIKAAYQINQGIYPELEPISTKASSDCLWHSGGSSPEQNVQTICDLIEHYIPQAGFNRNTDVQVLTPMSKGLVGTQNLNRVLQKLINCEHPTKAQLVFQGVRI
jgi:exodeoxyribonuclease V alpha subunit